MGIYGIIRAEKVKLAKINSNLQAHHQREKETYYSNPDIDLARTKDNVCLLHCDNFREEVNKQIQQHNIKKVRSDAVGMIDIISTCSSEFFANKSREWIIEYFKRQAPLIQKEFGILISANIHFDEKVVHAHYCTVPIIQNENGTYSLSAKRIMGNQKDYIERQDRIYNQWFSKFGLERGTSAAESHREHYDTITYKAKQEEKKLAISQSDIIDLLRQIEGLRNKITQYTTKLDKIRQQVNKTKQQEQQEIDYLQQLKTTVTELQNFISKDNYLQEVSKKVDNCLLRNGELPDFLKNKHEQFWQEQFKPTYDDMQSIIDEANQILQHNTQEQEEPEL